MRRPIVIALLLGTTCAAFAEDKDPIKEKLFTAKVAYDKEMRQVRKQIDDWFDKREEAARKVGDKQVLAQLKEERKVYEENGELPKSLPTVLQQKQFQAKRKLDAAYAEAAKEYIKAKRDDLASAVEKERSKFGVKESDALEPAREKYTRALNETDSKLLKDFDKTIENTTKQKLPTEQKLALLDTLKAEKKRFEERNFIPMSELMFPFLPVYFQSMQTAESQLRKSYSVEIEKALKAKNEQVVKDLRSDLERTIAPKVVARWRHQAGIGPGSIMVLYSNGKIGSPDSQNTWTLSKDGSITLRWPNPTAPGGAWLDVCKITPNGLNYNGANQKKVKITGQYIAD